jgi:hypothetical protein
MELVGNIAAIARAQGNNILLNLFFASPKSASMVAMQVIRSGCNFVYNFQTY